MKASLKRNLFLSLILILGSMIGFPCYGQEKTKSDSLINEVYNEREVLQLIEGITELLTSKYIFPDKISYLSSQLMFKYHSGKYRGMDGQQLAVEISEDLKQLTQDAHLNLRYSLQPIPVEQRTDLFTIPNGEREDYAKELKYENYGIASVEILKGNVGYIDFRFFCSPEFSERAYKSVMGYLFDTDALILDLRQCNGSSSPDALPFLLGYFFNSPQQLSQLIFRDKPTQKIWTKRIPQKDRLARQPIYILTSSQTFSGAEAFAYDLKVLNRAIIIGENSRGGANPGGQMRVNNHFSLFVPIAKSENPLSKNNWETIGVIPDIKVNSHLAKYHALDMAYHSLLLSVDSENRKHELTDFQITNSKMKPKMIEKTFFLQGFLNNKAVSMTGSFNFYKTQGIPMTPNENGWQLTLVVPEGDLFYRFKIDGKSILDPQNNEIRREGKFVNSYIKISQN